VGAHATVGVHDDFSAGDARIGLRAADHEDAGGVDVILDVVARILLVLLEDGLDDVLLDDLGHRLMGQARGMLSRDDDGVDALRAAILVNDRDLTLHVRAQAERGVLLPHIGGTANKCVGNRDRKRHQFGGLIRRHAEHHALVAGATRIHANRDVRRLLLTALEWQP